MTPTRLAHDPGARASARLTALFVVAGLVVGCFGGPTGQPTSDASHAPAASSPTTTIPPLANVTLQVEHAERATIGPDGGKIEGRDGRGATFSLTVPPGALRQEVEIVAIPIESVAGLPDELAVAGGVHFLPEGLRFTKLVELTMTLAGPPGAVIAPFAYDGDLAEPQRYPAELDGASATFGIVHFSGYGMLKATSAAIDAEQLGLVIPWSPPPGPADTALAVIAAALDGTTIESRDDTVNAALRAWLARLRTQVDEFRAMTTWDADGVYSGANLGLSGSFELWRYVGKLVLLQGVQLDPDLEAGLLPLVAATAVHSIATSNTGCAATSPARDLLDYRVPDEFVWQRIAEDFGVVADDPSLALEAVIENLCVGVVFDPNGGTDFPMGIQPGQTGTLNLRVGYAVDGGAPMFDRALDITITPHGAGSDAVVEGRTSADGRHTSQFQWDPDASQLRLDVNACLAGMPACQQAFVVRGTQSSVAPTVPSGGQCPVYEITVNGVTKFTTSRDGIAEVADNGRASARPGASIALNAFNGGTMSARIAVRYTIDASLAGPGPFDITMVAYGRVQDDGGGHATVKATVGEVTKTVTSPATDAQGTDVGVGTMEFPLTVQDGSVVIVELVATARSEAGRTIISTAISFLDRPEHVIFGYADCP